MNTNTQNKTNKNLIILIILLVSVIVLIFMGIIVYKFIKKDTMQEADRTPNITLLKCNLGRSIGDSDLIKIEEIARGIIGDNFIKIEKNPGMLPKTGFPTFENGEEIVSDVGDSITITFRLIETEAQNDVITAIANEYNFIHDYGYEFEKVVYQINFENKYDPNLK